MSRYLYLFLILLSPAAWAELTVTDEEYGLFAAPGTELQSGERIFARSSTAQAIQTTSTVPAKLGVKFGVRYSVSGKTGSDQVTLFYLTPGVVDENGERHDKFEIKQTLAKDAANHIIAFEFTEDYELVPGPWRLMVFERDRLLVDKTFEVRR